MRVLLSSCRWATLHQCELRCDRNGRVALCPGLFLHDASAHAHPDRDALRDELFRPFHLRSSARPKQSAATTAGRQCATACAVARVPTRGRRHRRCLEQSQGLRIGRMV